MSTRCCWNIGKGRLCNIFQMSKCPKKYVSQMKMHTSHRRPRDKQPYLVFCADNCYIDVCICFPEREAGIAVYVSQFYDLTLTVVIEKKNRQTNFDEKIQLYSFPTIVQAFIFQIHFPIIYILNAALFQVQSGIKDPPFKFFILCPLLSLTNFLGYIYKKIFLHMQ